MEKELCPSCGKVMQDHGEFGKICGMCWIWTYEIKNKTMEKYICIKTFVSDHGDFRRYYYGEEIKTEDFLMLKPVEQKFFVKIY